MSMRMSRRSWRSRYSRCDGSAKEIVREVFVELRKRGYLARMDFSCCGSCAGYELATKATELKDKGKTVEGCAFYHHQDETRYQDSGRLFIRFGHLGTERYGDLGKPTEEAGKEIVALLSATAVKHTDASGRTVQVEWDGQGHSCIQLLDVLAQEAEKAEKERALEREGAGRWASLLSAGL